MRRILIVSLLLCAPAFAAPLDEARELIDEGDYDEARAILERTVKDTQLESRSLILLTRLSNQLEDYESGIPYGKRAVKLSPDSAEAHFNLGLLLAETGRMAEAADELRASLDSDPSNASAALLQARMPRSRGAAAPKPGIALAMT